MPKTFYKLTDVQGDNVYTQYGSAHYELGKVTEVADFDTSIKSCGKGLHVCENIDDLFKYTNEKSVTDIKVFEVSVNKKDILASNNLKARVKKLKVVREVGNEEIYGPNHLELFELLKKLHTIPYGKPAKNLDLGLVGQLVYEHLTELGKYAKPGVFSGVTVKFVKTKEEYSAAVDGASEERYRTALGSAWYITRGAGIDRGGVIDVATSYASYVAIVWWRDEAGIERNVSGALAGNAAKDIITGVGPRPWMPLVEILALGCVPVSGLISNEFVVWVP